MQKKKIFKILIPSITVEKQTEDEKFFFFMSNWFLSEIKTLKVLYYFSMNVKHADGVEIYGRNYRTMLLGNLLASKLWEGWIMLQKAYFPTNIHANYADKFSPEAKSALEDIKKYFSGGKGPLLEKVRHTTFHYPLSEGERKEMRSSLLPTAEGDSTYYFAADTFEQSLFSIDAFIANYVKITGAPSVSLAMNKIHSDIDKNTAHFFLFLGEYIMWFAKKCTNSIEEVELGETMRRGEIEIPFFFH